MGNMDGMIAASVQGTVGLGQLLGGLFMKKGKRPVYQTPKVMQDSYRRAQAEENATADPMLAAAENRISQNTANTLSAQQKATKSSSQLLNAAGQAQVLKNAGMNNLAMQGMGMREQRRNRRYSLASVMGSFADREWEINEMQPYQGRAAAKRALMGAGLQNIVKSADTYAGVSGASPAASGTDTQAPTATSFDATEYARKQMQGQMFRYNQPNLYNSQFPNYMNA
jgi:hypothetical protein